jgi:hypothetical protein
MILLLTFRGNTLAKIEVVPIDVNNYRVKYQPKVLIGKAAGDVLDSMNAASARFKTKLERTGDRGILVIPAREGAGHPSDIKAQPSATTR